MNFADKLKDLNFDASKISVEKLLSEQTLEIEFIPKHIVLRLIDILIETLKDSNQSDEMAGTIIFSLFDIFGIALKESINNSIPSIKMSLDTGKGRKE